MARKGLWYQLEKALACRSDWNRTILRLERSWKELCQCLDKKDRGKKR